MATAGHIPGIARIEFDVGKRAQSLVFALDQTRGEFQLGVPYTRRGPIEQKPVFTAELKAQAIAGLAGPIALGHAPEPVPAVDK